MHMNVGVGILASCSGDEGGGVGSTSLHRHWTELAGRLSPFFGVSGAPAERTVVF